MAAAGKDRSSPAAEHLRPRSVDRLRSSGGDVVRLDHQDGLRERLPGHRRSDVRREHLSADPVGADHAARRLRRRAGQARPGPGGARRRARLGAGRPALVLSRPLARARADLRARRPARPLADPRRARRRQGDRLVRAAWRQGRAARPPRADRAHADLGAGRHGAHAARAVPRLLRDRHADLDRAADRRGLSAEVRVPGRRPLRRCRIQDHHRADRADLSLASDRGRPARRTGPANGRAGCAATSTPSICRRATRACPGTPRGGRC